MSPTIPILSALLLSLILGSTEGAQRMESVSLLRQTLRYWRKIYKTYNDEVTLGYCWVSYLFKISNDWSTNLSTLTLAAMETRSNVTVGTMLFDETHPRKKRRSQATAKSAVSKFTNDPDKHRIASRSKIIPKQRKRIMNKTEEALQIVPNNYTEWNGKIDEITRMMDSRVKRRRRAVSIVPELLRDERETPRDGHEFSSRGTSSHAVNPTPNPTDDDKVDSGSTDLGEEDSRRKVLRSLTSRRDSIVVDAFASRSFSLKVVREESLGGQRFPFRQYLPSRERSSRVEMLSDPWMQRDHRIEEDPAGCRASLNNDGSSSAPSRLQFRRVNADTKRSRVSKVVKLMDSEENLSCDLTINSKASRRKSEELSRDLLLSPRGGSAIAERSLFEFRGSGGGDAPKRNILAIQNGQRKRHEEETTLSAVEGELKERFNDTSVLFVGAQKIAPTNGLRKSRVFPRPDDSAEIEASRRSHSRSVRSVSSLSNTEQFNMDYENSTSQSTQCSKLNVSQRQLQLPDDWGWSVVSSIRSFIAAVFETLGMFVHVGRHIMNIIQTNAALICTKEYIWTKIIKWIDE